jgi:hypothetical protein
MSFKILLPNMVFLLLKIFFFFFRELDRRRRKRVEASGGRIPRLGERVECCRLHGIQEERRVQIQDRQNKVQHQQTMHRTRRVQDQDRQNKVQDPGSADNTQAK